MMQETRNYSQPAWLKSVTLGNIPNKPFNRFSFEDFQFEQTTTFTQEDTFVRIYLIMRANRNDTFGIDGKKKDIKANISWYLIGI